MEMATMGTGGRMRREVRVEECEDRHGLKNAMGGTSLSICSCSRCLLWVFSALPSQSSARILSSHSSICNSRRSIRPPLITTQACPTSLPQPGPLVHFARTLVHFAKKSDVTIVKVTPDVESFPLGFGVFIYRGGPRTAFSDGRYKFLSRFLNHSGSWNLDCLSILANCHPG